MSAAALILSTSLADLYNVTLLGMSSLPIISNVNAKGSGYTPCNYTFNPSFIAGDEARGVREGVLLRTAECPEDWGGSVDHIMWAPCNLTTGTCGDLVNDIVFPTDSQDPRIVYDPKTKLYHNFYYAHDPPRNHDQYTVNYAQSSGNPYNASQWSIKATLPWHRNGCVIIRDEGPHYIIYGEAPNQAMSTLRVATTTDFTSFTTVNDSWLAVDASQGEIVIEAASPPVRLRTGDYFHLYAAGTTGWVANGNYTAGYVILDSADPTKIIQKSKKHLIVSTYPYQNGAAPFPVQRKRTIFAQSATLLPESFADDDADYIRLWYGAADASVGTGIVRIERYP